MSQENVEVVQRAIQAAVRRPPDWQTVNALYDSGHQFVNLLDEVEGGESRGAAGWRDWLARMDQAGEWRIDIDRYRSAPDPRVVAHAQVRLTGDRSGAEIDARYGLVVTVTNGKVTRTEVFQTWEKALEAAGLSE